MKIYKVLVSVLSIYLLSSCVSLSKYQSLEDQNQSEIIKSKEYLKKNRELNAGVNENKSKIEKLNRDLLVCGDDKEKKFQDYVSAKKQFKKYETLYKELLTDKFSSGISTEETKSLLSKLQNYETDLQQREDKLSKARNELLAKKKKLNTLNKNILSKNKRLLLLERQLKLKDSESNRIKNSIAKALLSFKDKGLKVKVIDGKVYVSLDNKLLFSSGSYKVGAKGKEAIRQLAEVIAKNKDVNIIVEGHTDDTPYNGSGVISDNWDLSVRRATAIVKIMLKTKGISGKQLTAAGRSKYVPKYKSVDAKSRAKNRRIEIIITPNLKEIFNIIKE